MDTPNRRVTDHLDELACIDLLKSDLEKMPARTVPDMVRRMDRFIMCFLEFTRATTAHVYQLDQRLLEHGEEEIKNLKVIRGLLEKSPTSSPPPPPPFSWGTWFRDRVLPNLAIIVITGIVSGSIAWFFAVDAMMKTISKLP